MEEIPFDKCHPGASLQPNRIFLNTDKNHIAIQSIAGGGIWMDATTRQCHGLLDAREFPIPLSAMSLKPPRNTYSIIMYEDRTTILVKDQNKKYAETAIPTNFPRANSGISGAQLLALNDYLLFTLPSENAIFMFGGTSFKKFTINNLAPLLEADLSPKLYYDQLEFMKFYPSYLEKYRVNRLAFVDQEEDKLRVCVGLSSSTKNHKLLFIELYQTKLQANIIHEIELDKGFALATLDKDHLFLTFTNFETNEFILHRLSLSDLLSKE